MPMMDTGRGLLSGLFAATRASLELVTWFSTEVTPCGENK